MCKVSIEHRLIADTQTHRHGVAVKSMLAWRRTGKDRREKLVWQRLQSWIRADEGTFFFSSQRITILPEFTSSAEDSIIGAYRAVARDIGTVHLSGALSRGIVTRFPLRARMRRRQYNDTITLYRRRRQLGAGCSKVFAVHVTDNGLWISRTMCDMHTLHSFISPQNGSKKHNRNRT